MPINEISKGVFYLSTPKTEKYKMSAAGQYTTTFTKAKADLWDLSLKQALLEIQSKEEAYQLEMKSYLERQKQLDSLEAEMNLAVQQGNQKAINDAYKNYISVKATQDRTNADRALKASERVFPTASTSFGLGGGAGAGVKKAVEKLSADQAAYIKAIAAQNAGNVGATLAAIDEALGTEGVLRTSSPEIADAVRAVTMNEIVNVQVSQTGEPIEDAIVSVAGEANIVDPSQNYTNAFEKMLFTPEPPPTGGGAGGGAVSRVSGPVTKEKFGAEAERPGVDVTRPDLQVELLKQIELDRAALGKAPSRPESDLITTARDIFAGRAGPTMGASSAYKQRLVLDTLLKMSPEERAGIVKKYGGAQPAAEAVVKAAEAPAPAAPAAPVAIPPGASQYRDEATGAEGYLTPGNQKVETKPGTAAAPPAEPTVTPQPQAPILPQTPAPSVPVSQPQPSVAAPPPPPVTTIGDMFERLPSAAADEALQRSRAALERRAELEMLNIPQAPLTQMPEPTRVEQPKAPAPIVPAPALKGGLVPIQELEKPKKIEMPEPPKAERGTATTPKGRQMQYVEKVYEGAKELVAKKDKLSRVTSSGEGKLASEIYFGNKNQNKDFKKTWEEITISFADNPAARERAHTIAMALDLRSKSLNKTPEVA